MSVGSTAFHAALNPESTILSLEEKLIVSVSPAVTRSLGGDVLQWVPEKKRQDTQYIISHTHSLNTTAAHLRAHTSIFKYATWDMATQSADVITESDFVIEAKCGIR